MVRHGSPSGNWFTSIISRANAPERKSGSQAILIAPIVLWGQVTVNLEASTRCNPKGSMYLYGIYIDTKVMLQSPSEGPLHTTQLHGAFGNAAVNNCERWHPLQAASTTDSDLSYPISFRACHYILTSSPGSTGRRQKRLRC